MFSFLKHSASLAFTSLRALQYSSYCKPTRFILNYHDISNHHSSLFALHTYAFLQHIQHLCSIQQELKPLISPYPTAYEPEISITFDDGYLSSLLIAAPLLAAAGIPFTVFITTAFLHPSYQEYLNECHLLELAANPYCSIGSHCRSHTRLTLLSSSQCLDELVSSRHFLEDFTQKPVTQLSYPYGATSKHVIDLTQYAGYSFAYTTRPSPVISTTPSFLIPRFNILTYYSPRTLCHIYNNHLSWQSRFFPDPPIV